MLFRSALDQNRLIPRMDTNSSRTPFRKNNLKKNFKRPERHLSKKKLIQNGVRADANFSSSNLDNRSSSSTIEATQALSQEKSKRRGGSDVKSRSPNRRSNVREKEQKSKKVTFHQDGVSHEIPTHEIPTDKESDTDESTRIHSDGQNGDDRNEWKFARDRFSIQPIGHRGEFEAPTSTMLSSDGRQQPRSPIPSLNKRRPSSTRNSVDYVARASMPIVMPAESGHIGEVLSREWCHFGADKKGAQTKQTG